MSYCELITQEIEDYTCYQFSNLCIPTKRNRLTGVILLFSLGIGIIIALYFFASTINKNLASQK